MLTTICPMHGLVVYRCALSHLIERGLEAANRLLEIAATATILVLVPSVEIVRTMKCEETSELLAPALCVDERSVQPMKRLVPQPTPPISPSRSSMQGNSGGILSRRY